MTHSLRQSDADGYPLSRQNRSKSIATDSGRSVFSGSVAFPVIAEDVGREPTEAGWAERSVTAMLVRVRKMCVRSYLQHIGELGGES